MDLSEREVNDSNDRQSQYQIETAQPIAVELITHIVNNIDDILTGRPTTYINLATNASEL